MGERAGEGALDPGLAGDEIALGDDDPRRMVRSAKAARIDWKYPLSPA